MKYTLLLRKYLLKEERCKVCWILGKNNSVQNSSDGNMKEEMGRGVCD